MRIKKDLGLLLRRCFWHLKNLKYLFWIPVVVVNLIVPVLNYISYRTYGIGDIMRIEIMEKTMLLLPFFSVWWVIFILREYIDSDGSEVLYVCRNKIKIADALCPFLLYLVNISLLYSVYIAIYPDNMPMEYARMLCICCFFFGLTYFLIFLTKSITITLMVVLLYFIGCSLFPIQKAIFPLYYVQQELAPTLFFRLYLPMLASGGLLCAAGMWINKQSACKN